MREWEELDERLHLIMEGDKRTMNQREHSDEDGGEIRRWLL